MVIHASKDPYCQGYMHPCTNCAGSELKGGFPVDHTLKVSKVCCQLLRKTKRLLSNTLGHNWVSIVYATFKEYSSNVMAGKLEIGFTLNTHVGN